MNIKKILIGSAASAIVMGSVVMSAFAVGTNGSFESGTNPGSYLTVAAAGADIDSWTVDSGSVDYIGSYWQPSQGERSVDLNGNEQGSVSQVLTTVVGATYTVTFDLSGNPDGGPVVKTVNVSATGTAATPYMFDTSANGGNTHGDMKWTGKQYVFVATTTSTTLTFASGDEGAYGAAIDNVVIAEELPITPTPTVTPTPTPNPDLPAECNQGLTYNVIQGTNGSNIINGTNGSDLILAKGGSDVINGKGGDDCIVGGDGSDAIKGGADADVILGGNGSDAILGEDGADKIYGGDGSDAIGGGAGADQIWGGNGADAIKGDADNDNIDGQAGNDAVNGGTGNSDTCIAESKTQCEL